MEETLHINTPPKMYITIELRENYGKQMYYPHCAKSKTFASIADTVTLTADTLKLIKELGYGIAVTYISPDVPNIFD
jgi:hypothetical protein